MCGGRLPHALLVEGADRETRTAFAQHAAQAVLCAAPTEQPPCGACRDCVKAEKGIHPDILMFGGEGGARSFHIDMVRQIRAQAFIRPNEAGGKALVLLEVQEMSVQAQNALLKIIEEPPKGVTFILTCENKSTLLETIRSRVMAFSLHTSEGRQDDCAALDAKAVEILVNACTGSELEALFALNAYERDRTGLGELLESMNTQLKQAILHPGSDAAKVFSAILSRYDRLRLIQITDIIEDTIVAASQNVGGLLLVTSFCSRLRSL